MKRLALTALVVLLFPVLALAQAAAAAPPAVSFNDLLTQAFGMVATWKAGGWLVGSIALVNVVINVLKYPPVEAFLTGLKIGWWLRPLIAIVVGIVGGVFSNLVGGASVGTAILVSLLAGVSSTGLHELLTIWNAKTQAERGIGSLLVDAVSVPAPNGATGPAIPAPDPLVELQNKLTAIAALPVEARLGALSQLGKKS